MDRQRRRDLGAWYTPPALVDAVVAAALRDWAPPRGRPVMVLDPACGDGRFLAGAAEALGRRGLPARLVGIDVDPAAVDAAIVALAGRDATVVAGDALAPGAIDHAVHGRVDLVVGNPPFLSPLAARNGRVASSSPAGAPYADAAAQFLMRAWEALGPAGRIGFVLPQSVLANRDAAFVREAITSGGALRWLWWSPYPVFDAAVRTCAIVAERPDRHPGGAPVRRQLGPEFAAATDARVDGSDWGSLIADLGGVPDPGDIRTAGTLGDHAAASAGFRDEFYGVAQAVGDHADGPPLVTSGLIDPGVCHWGRRRVRVAKRSYAAPRVDLGRLPPRVRRWADRQLVPKVLVASQTKVIEAVADPAGEWLPGVPVVAVVPREHDDIWQIAAALTNPVTSAALTRAAGGTGLSAAAVRVAAKGVLALPWPAGDLGAAAQALRAGDVQRCGQAVMAAFGLSAAAGPAATLLDWWSALCPAEQP